MAKSILAFKNVKLSGEESFISYFFDEVKEEFRANINGVNFLKYHDRLVVKNETHKM